MPIIREIRGKAPIIGKNVFIAETAALIGEVTLGEDCSIWYNAVLRGDVNAIVIGNNVSIGHNAIIHGCTLKDNVLIGMGAIVLDGCVVESNSIVAAGAVVTKGTHIGSGEVWAGVPAKKIKDISPELTEGEINRIANAYVKYAQWYQESEE